MPLSHPSPRHVFWMIPIGYRQRFAGADSFTASASAHLMTIHDAVKTPFSLSFDEYVRMFPSAWLLEHFLHSRSGSRKILSSNALADRVARFSEPASLQNQFRELSEEDRRLCSLVYLCGDSGLPALERSDFLSDPVILSFLIYAGRDGAGAVRYFGFSTFEPSLRPFMAETILHAAPVTERAGSVSLRRQQWCRSDIAVVMALAMQGLLEKKKQGGLTKNSLVKIGKLTHDSLSGFYRPEPRRLHHSVRRIPRDNR